jgi:hypothetical protein
MYSVYGEIDPQFLRNDQSFAALGRIEREDMKAE